MEELAIELDDAVEGQRFEEAARLKAEADGLLSKDLYLQLEEQLAAAVDREDYAEAARLRDAGNLHLLGWWRGRFEEDLSGQPWEDPYGHLLKIDYSHGKLLGKVYSVKDLAVSMGLMEGHSGMQQPGEEVSIDMLGRPTHPPSACSLMPHQPAC